jgi:hypothetical protein
MSRPAPHMGRSKCRVCCDDGHLAIEHQRLETGTPVVFGDQAIKAETDSWGQRCTMCGITPQQAQQLFTPTVRDPNLKSIMCSF